MDYGPRKLFMMIRAGMKEAVLTSNTIWNCVSCYNCVVRCPRQVPVTYILHDLAALAVKEGYAEAKTADNARFAKAFWWSAQKWGRTDERLVTMKYYFSTGIGDGIKKGMANQKIAMAMVKTKRMHLTMPHKVKGPRSCRRSSPRPTRSKSGATTVNDMLRDGRAAASSA